MTATRSPQTAVAPLPETESLRYRPASPADIEALAALFQQVYGQTTHPCQNPGYIHYSMGSGQQQWFVAEAQGQLLGCCCIARRPWNRSWEVCHGVIHPDARRTGAISSLIRLGFETHRPEPVELGFYITRNIASHSVMNKIRPAVLVGHDGGPDTVDGLREYHLTAIQPVLQAGFVHVAPWYVTTRAADFVRRLLYPALRLGVTPGSYPETFLSGPTGAERHGQLSYTHDPKARALMLSGQCGCYLSSQAVLAELGALLRQHAQAEYVSLVILADKLELLASLRRLGFAITAYLPAWHLENGTRYDCLQLVFQDFDVAPRSHGFDDDIARFDLAYAHLANNLCSLPAAPASRAAS
ncbi:GNAT family N-acetyltransferase [Pseudomonas mosselii]|uniref:GNAT family N-acetyltransferase n=1 Tax=unclassified Pseudomonas TaxID=196821 RepID=UPI0020C59CFE|nr:MULTISPECIES: GNAT family N-acetyltransferase [unclassified Pseudomonas]MCP8632066.1 GNAT family N-acetyltransferase [Pseudomonas sp. DVZ6]MDD7783105.1 GNAT family N-acetyltransferase [Pseudomonas sp. DVZ24]